MKNILGISLMILLLTAAVSAQNSNSSTTAQTNTNANANSSETKSKRPPVFRATKDQIQQAQMKLKEKGMYAGEASGKLDDDTRAGLKKYQVAQGLNETGTLNRATLEKMGISLTETQMMIPVSESKSKSAAAGEKSSTPRFRATKDQITQAQKMLKEKGMYAGDASGTMTDDFRTALKKYQETNGLKATGTMSRETVEKMGIPLTDKQKAPPAPATK